MRHTPVFQSTTRREVGGKARLSQRLHTAWEPSRSPGPHSSLEPLFSPVVSGLSDSSSRLESHSPGEDEDIQEGGGSCQAVPGGANPPVEKTKEAACKVATEPKTWSYLAHCPFPICALSCPTLAKPPLSHSTVTPLQAHSLPVTQPVPRWLLLKR